MESLDVVGAGRLAHPFPVDTGFFVFQPAGLEQHSYGHPRRHLFPVELVGATAMKIIVYSTPSCVYCKMLKEFLKKNSVPYEEKDVSADLKAREEMVTKSHQLGVPVVDIDGEIFVGFNRAEIAKKLGIK
jgi:glutaredoxin-like YruB-family protein